MLASTWGVVEDILSLESRPYGTGYGRLRLDPRSLDDQLRAHIEASNTGL